MHTSPIVRPAPAPRGGTETVTLDLDGAVLIVDRSTARPPEHDHGVEILADLTTIDGRDAGRLIRVYPRRISLRVDADHMPRPLSRAERDQIDGLFPEPRFRVTIEHLGEYRIRDYGVPSGGREYTNLAVYQEGHPREAWEAAQADCARLNTGDLTPDPSCYPPTRRRIPRLRALRRGPWRSGRPG
ncbi:hypothetical protein [Parafrankia discariae]|uniref:hypothetical protein n=1 Tax=Parafrankia discariae TaxID=365528 RepID=UPI0003A9973A|nr:hypothetical protein [Parafrankia discariae]